MMERATSGVKIDQRTIDPISEVGEPWRRKFEARTSLVPNELRRFNVYRNFVYRSSLLVKDPPW